MEAAALAARIRMDGGVAMTTDIFCGEGGGGPLCKALFAFA
jgi:hypothetical protein